MLVDHRAGGILCHPTSLPGPFGIGDLGPQARRFVDFLQATGQTLWQVLPLGPTGFADSPYMCLSAFGGNPLLISLETLAEEGWLQPSEFANPPVFNRKRVQYGRVHEYKPPLLQLAYQCFQRKTGGSGTREFREFCQHNESWLEDYALFKALKEAHEQRSWSEWEPGAAQRDPDSLDQWRNRLQEQIRLQRFLQWIFFEQWQALRHYANAKGIRIIGDIPIYVAYDSADVWANRRFFRLDKSGRPTHIAGVPPDYFSATGQRWGNPIYRWDTMKKDGYGWWIERFRMEFAKCDFLRLDHFRGFEAYWEIPAGEDTAVNGRWVKGPGAGLFEVVRSALESSGIALRIIAEDLGVITPAVDALRDELGFPGMRILQMAFGTDPKSAEYLPHHHVPNSVVYTSTHDHNTTVGWFTAEPGSQSTQTAGEIGQERQFVKRYLGTDGREIQWDFIRLASSSVAWMAIYPLQDVLGLGTESRMNRPGRSRGNWEWRFVADSLTPAICRRLAEIADVYERSPSAVEAVRARSRVEEVAVAPE